MKLKLFGEQPQEEVRQKDESDAMKGKYHLQALDFRMRQHAVNALVDIDKDGKVVDNSEHWLDTQQRQLSITTTGQGALGKDYPISAENRLARERLLAIARWADIELTETNKLRIFMARYMNDSHHTVFDRSVEFDEPDIVLTYKPMMYPGPSLPPQTADDQDKQQDRKKP